ncbi:MAG: aryl-sulfate sulfotransferase, partial [Bacteroidota bacterium]
MKKFLHLLASFSFALLFGLPLHAQFEITRILGQSSKGLILYSDLSLKNTYLINRCGEIINLWEHENPPGLSARLLKNGHLLRAEYIRGSCCEQVSSGGLIQMLDWDNAVIWQHLVASPSETQHHDFTFLPNGNVAYLGWEAIDEEEQLALGVEDIQPFLWLEFIREVKPIGTDSFELVWEWKMENHLIQDKNPNLPNYRASVKDHLGKIDVNYIGPASYNRRHRWHVNSIEYNEERDEIMVNTRDNSEVWIIDHSTSTEEAASDSGGLSGKGGQLLFRWGNPEAYGRGDIGKLKMYGSHGLVWLDSLSGFRDYILFFNNGDERQGGGGDRSTVEMIKPMIDEEGQYVLDVDSTYLLEDQIIVYGENPQTQPLRSQFLSNAEKLKNGFLI